MVELNQDTRHGTLLLSIHDVGPRFANEVDRLRDLLGQVAPADKIALLVVPNHWGEAPITAKTPFASRLREWADAGAEIFVHGWFHKDDTQHTNPYTRLKAQHLTAREGEFVGLTIAEASARMAAGKALLEDICGRSVAGFVAPAWLYSIDTNNALAENGFSLAEDHWRIWHPPSGKVIGRGPVLTWASRSRARIMSSLFVARVMPPMLREARLARLAVHPGDTTIPAIMQSIQRALAALAFDHNIGRYDSLLPADLHPCAS
ncbi:hypothetical protein NT2_05_02010 [Caenibius tardaugens NBRC 16725]|uniref:DUF2334 domain-containing protein n=1 Tax=Caenibius tardaugens NBRC 16725 TaxID=1219035 RepID=U2Y7U2_9SPHN|nr:polysaccharide deacetylase family protein [Caenibius tardaugens]AZI36628.1 DUF2334 domain-containing protein [Caenibius tardaugens NBRC 16725]GAD49281.1 hypothetical protein NT2_05_02010 [Caenibius tardaugens NBRC 16725]